MNGIQMLSKTLQLHPDQPTSLAEAISTLAEIVWASPKKGGAAIIQRGTSCLDLTLAALVRHPVDAMVQQMACGLFRALSYNRDCCAKLNSKRVVLAVVDSIRRNTEEPDVVMEARFVQGFLLYMLYPICYPNNNFSPFQIIACFCRI
jgi:hypothetical protein